MSVTQPRTHAPMPEPADSSHGAAIRAQGLTKRYGATLALEELDLAVAPGEVYGYLGPNGSGKTTTIRLLLGLHRPAQDRRSSSAIDAWSDPVAAHRRIAYVAGEPFLWPAIDERRDVRVPRTAARRRRRRLPRDACGALPARPAQEDQGAVEGQPTEGAADCGARQRAELLLLDEPTSGLDPLMEVHLPRLHQGGQGARADRFPLLAHPQRGGGALRSCRDPARGQARRRGTLCSSYAISPRRRSRSRSRAPRRACAAAGRAAFRAAGRTRCASRSRAASAR